eukprot:CAMPEP_0116991182 /NCGR_PEP_ID=MMETSP0467-20121206/65976_1 /TAXON_ID=283647 /ORGANISM="Mesodinium pulex, Strain SPMC105" /LENGTH=180 /DNA_ID=CAMNT_0004688197 /DNA_START=377 /DNA_END=919 /DNA_ORIENTATION=-
MSSWSTLSTTLAVFAAQNEQLVHAVHHAHALVPFEQSVAVVENPEFAISGEVPQHQVVLVGLVLAESNENFGCGRLRHYVRLPPFNAGCFGNGGLRCNGVLEYVVGVAATVACEAAKDLDFVASGHQASVAQAEKRQIAVQQLETAVNMVLSKEIAVILTVLIRVIAIIPIWLAFVGMAS